MIIKNGKLTHSNDDYPHDFHEYWNNNILSVFLILPGIKPESILIKITKNKLDVTAYFDRKYFQLFKKQRVHIFGSLSCEVEPKSYQTEYLRGILKINLTKKIMNL